MQTPIYNPEIEVYYDHNKEEVTLTLVGCPRTWLNQLPSEIKTIAQLHKYIDNIEHEYLQDNIEYMKTQVPETDHN